jgi:chemotaxis methyl-accepting protein methylase
MRELGIATFEEYYNYIVTDRRGKVEWLKLVDRLTVHETRFMRHPASFRLIEEHFLPAYTATEDSPRSLQAWSVGCASGEEAYTLAMILARFIRERQSGVYYSVMATDISRDSLAIARAGRYAAEHLSQLETREIESLFEWQDGVYQVRDEVRRRVCFSEQNVMRLAQAPLGQMDIIFCQNLLIYFTQVQRQKIAQSLVDYLKPGGLLVLGIGEMVSWKHASLQRVEFEDTLAYQKVKD